MATKSVNKFPELRVSDLALVNRLLFFELAGFHQRLVVLAADRVGDLLRSGGPAQIFEGVDEFRQWVGLGKVPRIVVPIDQFQNKR